MKKPVQILYILLIICGVLLPIPLFPVLKGMVDTGNYENRNLEEFPRLTAETWDDYPERFEAYLQDHLPFRNQLVHANGVLDYYIVHDTTSKVTLGRDGWLYYGGRTAETSSLHNYIADDIFTEDQMQLIRSNLLQTEEALNERGIELVILLVPDKHRVYPEHYAEYMGEPRYPNRLSQVTECLQETTDLTVISAYDALMAYRQEDPDMQLYWKYDSHWNLAGSYIAASLVNEALGIDMPPLSALSNDGVMTGEFDLAKLLLLRRELSYDQNYSFSGYTDNVVTQEPASGGNGTAYSIEGGTGDPRTVILHGDSFSNVMARYIACNYNTTVHISHWDASPQDLDEYEPDVIILELCERNLGELLHIFLV